MPRGYDRLIHISMIVLAVYGTLMIGSASMGKSAGDTKYLLINVGKQIGFIIIGCSAMVFTARKFSVRLLKSDFILGIIFGTIAILLVCLLFKPVGGARAWIRIPLKITEISIQPSEFAKITAILIIAAYCGDVRKTYPRKWDLVKRPLGFIAVICLIVWKFQGDFGSMAVIAAISAVCFLIPSHRQLRPFQILLIVISAVLLGAVIFVLSPAGKGMIEQMSFLKEYQKNRFLSAIDPFYDRYNTGFQLIKGLTSIASGGWFGVGFGNSINKYSEFPAADTDYILAILIEELGFTGFLVLMALYGIIIVRNFLYALRIRNESARIILIGTSAYLLLHMFFNIGGVTGLIPLTGVPLLMISAGGSSTISFMTAIGICQAVISAYNRAELS